jgi:hypothetical protein
MFKRKNIFLSFKRCLNVLFQYQRLAHIKKTVENFEWSNILGLGMGEADANDDEGLEVVEEGQVRSPWPTGNISNWPQEPTFAKLTDLHGTKVPLGVLFEGIDLLDSY